MPRSQKRVRTPISCAHCRRKKGRCDKQRPYCGRCVADNCTDQCVYVLPTPLPDGSGPGSNDGIQNPDDNGITVVGYLKHSDGNHNYLSLDIDQSLAILPSRSLDGLDPETYNVYIEPRHCMVHDDMLYLGITHFFSMVCLNNEFYQFSNSQVERKAEAYGSKTKERKNISGFLYHPSVNTTTAARRPTEKFAESNRLPEQKYVILFIERFFDVYGPMAPFLDREVVTSELLSLITDHGEYSTINPSKLHEKDLISILLIILRFGFFTFYSNPLNECSNVIINKTYVDYASKLLLNAGSFNKFSINKIHGLLLLVIYSRNSPEGDVSHFSTNTNLLLAVQCARRLGLNQDIKWLSGFELSEKEKYIWKVTWIFICYMDANQAYNHGLTPLTTPREHRDFDIKEAAKFCKPSMLRVLNLMHNSSKAIIKFLNGRIQDRVINKKETLSLLRDIKDLIYGSCRTFEQLRSQSDTVPKFDNSCIEKALELNLRLDLYYKEYSLYLILFQAAEKNEEFAKESKHKYFSQALERALVMLRLSIEFNENSKSFLGQELELNVSNMIMTTFKIMIPCVATCIKEMSTSSYLILEAILDFNSPDSIGLIDWLSSSTDNTDVSVFINIINKIAHFYSITEEKFGYYSYSCFKNCLVSELVVSFARERLPHYFETHKPVASDDMFWLDSINLDPQLEFWESQFSLENLLELVEP